MTAAELAARFALQPHPENGSFRELHYESTESRPASGSILYYVAPGERTRFHVIDCDEYWCRTAGAPLELWLIEPDGTLSVRSLGVEADCEPFIRIPAGVCFAARHCCRDSDGALVTCITVPRFRYEGFTMLSAQEAISRCPAAAAFYQPPEQEKHT